MVESDFAACEGIYLANEADHFPDGFFDIFKAWLRMEDSLKLVAELDGGVVGLGGITLRDESWGEIAILEFGMVHPRFAKCGVGTALLLSRLGALPDAKAPRKIVMSSAGASISFYKRFGFAYLTKQWVKEEHLAFYVALLSTASRIECRKTLEGISRTDSTVLNRPASTFPKRNLGVKASPGAAVDA